MTNKYLKELAELRAKELFTKEFFETCTDSWYYDEFFEFKSKEVGPKKRKPTDNAAYKYMGYLQNLKDEYYDNLYSSEHAMEYYGDIISKFREIINTINVGKDKSKKFECTDDIYDNIRSIGNYFVYKYNSELTTRGIKL